MSFFSPHQELLLDVGFSLVMLQALLDKHRPAAAAAHLVLRPRQFQNQIPSEEVDVPTVPDSPSTSTASLSPSTTKYVKTRHGVQGVLQVHEASCTCEATFQLAFALQLLLETARSRKPRTRPVGSKCCFVSTKCGPCWAELNHFTIGFAS